MNKISFEIVDDVVIRHTPMPEIGENIYKSEVVMTKEIFQECYKKWVMPQENTSVHHWDKDELKKKVAICFAKTRQKVRRTMGIVRNEMTIVHHWNKDDIETVREDAIKMFSEAIREDLKLTSEGSNEHIDYYIENMISSIMRSYMNQEYTFVINGECSLIGWDTSERFHEVRMKWCKKHKHDVQNIIVISFGEDDDPCRIVFDSNKPCNCNMDEDDEESAGQMDKEKQEKENPYERIAIIENEIEELFERVKNVEDLIKEDKEEQLRKLKAESEYLKFRLKLDEESSRMKVRRKNES